MFLTNICICIFLRKYFDLMSFSILCLIQTTFLNTFFIMDLKIFVYNSVHLIMTGKYSSLNDIWEVYDSNAYWSQSVLAVSWLQPVAGIIL
jgi:hypothetical protein